PVGLLAGREEGGVLSCGFLGEETDLGIDAGALQNLNAPTRLEIGIAQGRHHMTNARGPDRVGAWRCLAVMRAGLEVDDEGRPARPVAGCLDGVDFRVRPA